MKVWSLVTNSTKFVQADRNIAAIVALQLTRQVWSEGRRSPTFVANSVCGVQCRRHLRRPAAKRVVLHVLAWCNTRTHR